MKRRDILLASLGTGFADAALPADATDDGASSFRNVFGTPNYESPSDSLKFMAKAQELRVAVPKNLEQYSLYLNRLPLIQQLQKTGPFPR